MLYAPSKHCPEILDTDDQKPVGGREGERGFRNEQMYLSLGVWTKHKKKWQK